LHETVDRGRPRPGISELLDVVLGVVLVAAGGELAHGERPRRDGRGPEEQRLAQRKDASGAEHAG
jgi:hypothetical protein